MKYDPKDASNVIAEGTYDASIRAVLTEKDDGSPLRTQAGDDMQKVVWTVYTDRGDRMLTEYHAGGKMLWRYKKLAKALGAGDKFDKGEFNATDFIGENARLVIEVEDNPKYGEQNRITAYEPRAGGTPLKQQPSKPGVSTKGIPVDPTGSDEIPFD